MSRVEKQKHVGDKIEIEFGLFSDIHAVMEGFCPRCADWSDNVSVA